MDSYIVLTVACLALSLILLFTRQRFMPKALEVLFKMFLILASSKYIALLVFYSAESANYLFNIKYLPITSTMFLFVVGYMILSYIGKEALRVIDYIFLGLIILISGYIIHSCAVGITGCEAGYLVIKDTKWMYLESLFIAVTSIVIIVKALKKFMDFKSPSKRISYSLLILGFISLIVENVLELLGRGLYDFNIISDVSILGIILAIIIINIKRKKK
ncbi:MAG: hypothetical protein RR840_01300 [Clostridium sp.]